MPSALHPTIRVQAPLTFEAPSELWLDTAPQFGRTLTARMDLSAQRNGAADPGLRVFVAGDDLMRDVPPDSATDRFDIRGYGATCDAHHRIRLDESGEEPARAMTLALAEARLPPEAIGYLAYHGTSTEMNAPEAVAGDRCGRVSSR